MFQWLNKGSTVKVDVLPKKLREQSKKLNFINVANETFHPGSEQFRSTKFSTVYGKKSFNSKVSAQQIKQANMLAERQSYQVAKELTKKYEDYILNENKISNRIAVNRFNQEAGGTMKDKRRAYSTIRYD